MKTMPFVVKIHVQTSSCAHSVNLPQSLKVLALLHCKHVNAKVPKMSYCMNLIIMLVTNFQPDVIKTNCK